MTLIRERWTGAAAAALLGTALLVAPMAARAQGTPSAAAPAPAMSAPGTAAPMAPAKPRAKRAPRSHESQVDAYITSLHKKLMITDAQESQWNKVADVMRDNAGKEDQLASEYRGKRSTMSAVDNLRAYEAIADAHSDELKGLVPAFSSLYDSMSEAQKKNADTVFQQQRRARARSRAAAKTSG